MNIKPLIASVALIGFALPALADSTYFVVRGADKHCTVVDQRPVTKEITIVGPEGTTYKTKTEAETAMKTVCK